MSIRKVSDLESVSFSDGSQQLSDINDSLLEVSFPQHIENVHSYKSMKVRYEDMRADISGSIFNSDTSATFAMPVEFTGGVSANGGLDATKYVNANVSSFCISGDLSVNAKDQEWQQKNVYMRAGDIALIGNDEVKINAGNNVTLSSPAIQAYSDSMTLSTYNGTSVIAKFNENQIQFTPQITIPKSNRTNKSEAVNVELLEEVEDTLRSEIEKEDTEGLQLVETNLYTNDDIINVEYMLEKKYRLIETNDDNTQTTSYFLECDIKSKPTGSTSGEDAKLIYLPNIVELSTAAFTLSETTNATTTENSIVQTTKMTLIPIPTYTNYIMALSAGGVGSSQSLNAHMFAKMANLDAIQDNMLFPWKSTNMYDFSDKGIADNDLYAFSTPLFTTDGKNKFYINVTGTLSVCPESGSYVGVDIYAIFTPLDYSSTHTDGIVLSSSSDRSPTDYPYHERMYPQRKSDASILTGDAIINADNGYTLKSGSKYKTRNLTRYSYASRYAYVLSSTSTDAYEETEYGTAKTNVNREVKASSNFFKKLGTAKVYKNKNKIQFRKTLTIKTTDIAKANSKSMRIVFIAASDLANSCIRVVSDKPLKISVMYLEQS